MIRRKLIVLCVGLSLFIAAAVAYGIVFVSGPNNGPVVTQGQAFTAAGSSGFAFNNTGGTAAVFLSSGGSAATSTPCDAVVLSVAGTGSLCTSGGTVAKGFTWSTSGTGTFTSVGPVPISNLNALTVTGTGQVGYFYY